jgi:TRAP-type C4-dicarboxylate transport system substrate-binding protein
VPASNKFYEVQKYLSMTNHMSDAFILALSDKKWDSLSSADKKILSAAAAETAKFKTQNDADLQKSQVKELESHGMKVNELSSDGLKEFKQIARSLYPQFADVVGGKSFLDKTTAFVDSL